MRTILTRHGRIILTIVLTLLARPAIGQNVHIVADPDHADPNAIYLTNTHVKLDITSGVAHATLTQTFHNPNPWQAEGIYLFPLPEGAAFSVFRLTMDG